MYVVLVWTDNAISYIPGPFATVDLAKQQIERAVATDVPGSWINEMVWRGKDNASWLTFEIRKLHHPENV